MAPNSGSRGMANGDGRQVLREVGDEMDHGVILSVRQVWVWMFSKLNCAELFEEPGGGVMSGSCCLEQAGKSM